MIVLPELWDFMMVIYEKNLFEAKQTKQYRLLKNIFEHYEEIPIAIPYWSLFDNKDYIECLIYDFCNVQYDDRLCSFVFKNLPRAFFGIQMIFKKLNEENPNDYEIKEKSEISIKVLKYLKETSSIDELSSVLNGMSI